MRVKLLPLDLRNIVESSTLMPLVNIIKLLMKFSIFSNSKFSGNEN